MKGSRRRTLYHDRGIFTAQPEADKKRRSRGGFQPGSPLTHMNRHKQQNPPEKTKPWKEKTNAN